MSNQLFSHTLRLGGIIIVNFKHWTRLIHIKSSVPTVFESISEHRFTPIFIFPLVLGESCRFHGFLNVSDELSRSKSGHSVIRK